ncbi:MAG TPA: UDP-glucose 6-dehydrogenase, partial [Arenibaculum sp.]|nr:UDP-glucose 6-dehydrogenase [Arenibaculum sp.]
MKVVVFGLGYVGTTMTACMLQDGHDVVGIDISAAKVALVRGGRSPIVEPGVDRALAAGMDDGRLGADIDAAPYIPDADMAVVCVGTPSKRDGTLNLSQVVAAAGEIGGLVKSRPRHLPPLLVVFRSTMP